MPEIQLGGGITLPSQLEKILDTPNDARLLDAPSNYVIVNDSDMLGTAIVENSCIILFDWNTFINKIIGVDDQSALKKDFIGAIEDVLGRLNIQSSVSDYEKVLNREINKSLLDFRVTLANTLGGSSSSFSIENFDEQWIVKDRTNAFYGQSIIQEGIRFVIEAKGRFLNPDTNERDFYRIFTGFIETISETNNPLDKKLSYTATDMSYLLSGTRFNMSPALHEKDPIAKQETAVIFRNVLESKSTEQIFNAVFSKEQTDKIEIRRPFYWKIETGKNASIGFNSDNLGLVEEDYRRNWHVKSSSTQIRDYAFGSGSSQDKPFNPMVLLWGHTGLAYAEVFGALKLFISAFKTRQDILIDLANIVFFKTYVDGAGNVHFHPPRFEEEAYLQLKDGYMSTEETEHPLTYTVFDDDTIAHSYSQSSKEICTVARGHGEGGYGIYKTIRDGGTEPNYLKASIAWPDGINRFGFREGNISTSAVGGDEGLLNAFTAAFLIRRNQERFNMTATMVMRPELQVDRPIYDYNKDKIYYIRSVTHTYSAGTPTSGGTYTTSISCNAGRRIGEKISSNVFATAKSLKNATFEDAIKNYADSYNLKDYREL